MRRWPSSLSRHQGHASSINGRCSATPGRPPYVAEVLDFEGEPSDGQIDATGQQQIETAVHGFNKSWRKSKWCTQTYSSHAQTLCVYDIAHRGPALLLLAHLATSAARHSRANIVAKNYTFTALSFLGMPEASTWKCLLGIPYLSLRNFCNCVMYLPWSGLNGVHERVCDGPLCYLNCPSTVL